jgi:hypothetical protein
MLERLAGDKHSSLLPTFPNYRRIEFCKIAPKNQFCKTYFSISNKEAKKARVFALASLPALPNVCE